MIRSMVVADILVAFGVLGRYGYFHFARGPGDDNALVADLGSSCARTGGQWGKVKPHVYILDRNKFQEKSVDQKKILHDPKVRSTDANGPSLNYFSDDLKYVIYSRLL